MWDFHGKFQANCVSELIGLGCSCMFGQWPILLMCKSSIRGSSQVVSAGIASRMYYEPGVSEKDALEEDWYLYIYIIYWSFQPSYLLIHSVQNILNHTYIAYMLQFCFLGCHQAMDMPQLSMGSPHRGWHATLEPPKWHSSTPPNSRYWWYLSCRWGRKMSEMIYGTRMY